MPQAARPARPRPEDPAARRRRIGAILLAIVAALAIAAVLSSAGGVESGDVADVEDAGNVSKQDFDHWLTVVSSQPQPGQTKPSKPPKPGSQQYDAVKQQVMQFLVSAKWIDGEAKERGLSATDAEVARQFKQTKDQSFPNNKAYQRFLKTLRPDRAGPPLPRASSTSSRTRSASRSPRRAQTSPTVRSRTTTTRTSSSSHSPSDATSR